MNTSVCMKQLSKQLLDLNEIAEKYNKMKNHHFNLDGFKPNEFMSLFLTR